MTQFGRSTNYFRSFIILGGQCSVALGSCLKESLAVDPTRDLPDEDGGEALGPQPLVHAQKVDLHHLHSPEMLFRFGVGCDVAIAVTGNIMIFDCMVTLD